jgi:hypothetical protein
MIHGVFLLSGSDGTRYLDSIMIGSVIFLPTYRLDSLTKGGSERASTAKRRFRKLTEEQRAEVVRQASTFSLREMAMRFEVSHETIRSVLLDNIKNVTEAD